MALALPVDHVHRLVDHVAALAHLPAHRVDLAQTPVLRVVRIFISILGLTSINVKILRRSLLLWTDRLANWWILLL